MTARAKSVPAREPGRVNMLVACVLLAFLLCLAAVWLLLSGLSDDYRANVVTESANHLIETNQQIKLYLEERFHNEYKVAASLANSICLYGQEDMDDILPLLQRERDIWELSDIVVYTESGYCVGTDGAVKPNDEASDIIYRARMEGEFMQIVQSTITYTLPVTTALRMNGSPLAAVSVVKNLNSLIDDMGFTSFGGAAYIYLTEENGVVVSQLTHPQAQRAYNLFAMLDDDLTCMTHGDHALGTLAYPGEACAYMCDFVDGMVKYIVTLPIDATGAFMRLFYFVPEATVNSTMLGFSSRIANMSAAAVAVFSVCALLAFIFLYRARKRRFDSAIVARDRMFDLLVRNTRNAFALMSIGKREPLYMSSNVENIIGDRTLYLARADGAVLLASAAGNETEATRAINQTLKDWDGKGEFVSDFAPYSAGGVTRYFVLRLYPVADADDEFIAIAQDVTGEREREEALKNALIVADTASLAKTRFLANMSHDIRTPMNVIINMTEFAIDASGDPDKQMEYLNMIRDSSGHLLRLINDILDMSRIESGQAVTALEPFNLRECVTGVCAMIAPLYQKKEQTFTVRMDDLQTVRVVGDKLKFTRVLVNLLNNAVKFTKPGGHIALTAQELPSLRENAASFRFMVEDDGEGIAPEHLSRIFEPFSRIEGRESQSAEGSGLGLSICRSYVQIMGGTISCKSALGEGSTFTVELFFEKDSASAVKRAPLSHDSATRFTGKRALLCEDHAINQIIARSILEKLGFEVTIAKDGDEAVRVFEASKPWHFDIVYMDIQMPAMNGYDATHAIRASARPDAQSVPIIAMTANVFAEDVEKARVAGMNGHLGKPLMVDQLVAVTSNAIAQSKHDPVQEGNP